MIEETHRDKTLKEISNKFIDDQSAYVTYGETIKVISGKKGTVFVEKAALITSSSLGEETIDTEIYYVLARKIPPERPRTLYRFGGDVLPTQGGSMSNEITSKQLRSFGFMVGGIFAAIAIWPLIVRGGVPRWWAMVLAAFLILPAAIFPGSLAWPHRGWMWIGHVLGWINTRIILGFVFYLVVTPTGLFRRWLGKDPMGQKLRPDLNSYRITREPRPASHLKKQY